MAEIARRLGVSRPTVYARMKALEHQGLIRLLPFLGAGGKPLLYLRRVYGQGSESFRSYCTEEIIEGLRSLLPEAGVFWWRAGSVRQVDLVVVIGRRRVGFCFANTPSPQNRDWWPLRVGCHSRVIHRGFLIYTGDRAFGVGRIFSALPLNALLSEMKQWLLRRRTLWETVRARARYNKTFSRCAGPFSGSRRALVPPARPVHR